MNVKRTYRKPMCEAIDHRTEDLCITSMGMYDEYGTFQGA